jgi:hypothetical protein
MRRLLLILPVLLAACDRQPPAPEEKQRAGPVATRPAATQSNAEGGSVAERRNDESEDAAAALRRYYAAIEKGDYETAFELRTASRGIERERFAVNFKAYESYRATVGTPSLPARSGEWEFVEVPVMITGRLRGGRSFGNSGSVTLRRPASGVDRTWRIFTG